MAFDRVVSVPSGDFKRNNGSGFYITYSFLQQQSRFWVPDKVSGGFTTFPDGSKFRLPTGYKRRRAVIEPGSACICYAVENGTNREMGYITQPGADYTVLFSGNSPLVYTSGGSAFYLSGSDCPPSDGFNEAKAKALLDLADAKAGIAEDLATFRQTVGLLHNPVSSLVKSLKKAYEDKSLRPWLNQSLRQAGKKGIPNIVANKYLEYVYGWLPLMGDIHGIIEMAKQNGQRPLLVSGRSQVRRSGQTTQGSHENFDGTTWKLGPLQEETRIICKLWARIDPDHAFIRSLNQLGLLNPLSLAYELTPWSFVVDWVLPIGSVLQALSAPAGLIYVSGTISQKTTLTGPGIAHFHGFDGHKVSTNTDGSVQVTWTGWNRQVLPNWPLPGLWVNPDPFSGDRPFKALALAISNLGFSRRTLR